MDKRLGLQDVREVYSMVRTAQDKWKNIGRNLGLSEETLSDVEARQTEAGKCLYSVLNLWLTGKGGKTRTASWRTLIVVLKSADVSKKELVDKILEKKDVKSKATCISSPDLHKRDEVITGTKPMKADVLALLGCISYQWRLIGELLEVPYHKIQSIYGMKLLSDVENLSEVIQYWYDNSSDTTWDMLISVIEKPPVSNKQVADSIRQFLNNTKAHKQMPELKKSVSDISSKFVDYVKSLYQAFSLNVQKEQWPPTVDVEYINLALMKQDKIPVHSDFQNLLLQASMKGDIEAAVTTYQDRSLSLEGILDYNAPRKVIIVEGSPGIGKTTLACKLCYDWAVSNSLQEYWLLLYIPLRTPLMRTAEKFEDIMEYFGDSYSYSDVSYIKQTQGKGVLVILDGWDELRPSCRDPNMFFPKFLQGHPLSQCSIIVTSRSNAVVDIRKFSSRQIEILGFTKEQIHQYIQSYFKDNKVAGEKLIIDLEAYPNVASTCYVAINLTIVCYVYLASGCQLPSTLTEVYEEFLIHAVKRYLLKVGEANITDNDFCSLEECDEHLNGNLNKLASLALKTLENDELGFTKKELIEACVVDETEASFDGYGLLKMFNIFKKRGMESYCYFLHSSIHEYLAAYSIFCMHESKQFSWLGNNIRNSKFDMVLKFFCGMDRFKSKPAIILFSSEQTLGVPFALECIFEGQWTEVCKKVAKQLSSVLFITRRIEPYRALVFGYVMAMSQCPWKLQWYNVALEEQQLRCLSRYVCGSPRVLSTVSLQCVSFASTKTLELLAEILKSQHFLSCLILEKVSIDQESGSILDANEHLQSLCLVNCSFTKDFSSYVCSIIQKLFQLEYLDIHGNDIGESGCLEILCAAASCNIKKVILPNVHKTEELLTKVDELNTCGMSIEFF